MDSKKNEPETFQSLENASLSQPTREKQNNWNLPNFLTVIRFLLVGVFVYLFSRERYKAAVTVFVLAALTDLLDGYIARKYDLVTDFGKLADPLADKLMLIAALACLAERGILPMPILIFVLVKEGVMIVGSALLYKKEVVVYAKNFGKAATFCFNASVILTFLGGFFPFIVRYHLHLLLFGVAIVLAVCALLQYVNSFWKQSRRKNED